MFDPTGRLGCPNIIVGKIKRDVTKRCITWCGTGLRKGDLKHIKKIGRSNGRRKLILFYTFRRGKTGDLKESRKLVNQQQMLYEFGERKILPLKKKFRVISV